MPLLSEVSGVTSYNKIFQKYWEKMVYSIDVVVKSGKIPHVVMELWE